MHQQFDGDLCRATELARERPLCPSTVHRQATEHTRSGRCSRQLLQLHRTVEGIEIDTERMCPRDVAFSLDRVAETEAVGRNPKPQAAIDFTCACQIEADALVGERSDHRAEAGLAFTA